MKDTEIKELDKCECVSSAMTIAPVLNIEIEKTGPLGIIMIIDDGVYVFICVLKGENRETTKKLFNMLRKFFEGTCIVKYAFKITSCDS